MGLDHCSETLMLRNFHTARRAGGECGVMDALMFVTNSGWPNFVALNIFGSCSFDLFSKIKCGGFGTGTRVRRHQKVQKTLVYRTTLWHNPLKRVDAVGMGGMLFGGVGMN